MTLWNPLNVFSGHPRPAGDETSASFDPYRSGDPLGPNPGRPAIGPGDAQIGRAAGSGETRRHPVGFAPPEGQTSGQRYRTEISFKRHHELPRASATLQQPDGHEPSPATHVTVVPAGDAPEAAGSGSVEELAAVTDVVPFYKREIGFRRRRPAPEEVAATAAVLEADEPADDVAEVMAQAEEHDELEEQVEAVEEPEAPEAAEVVAVQEPLLAEEAPEAETAPEAEEVTPFYKREISFRRKRPAPEEVAEVVAQGEEREEPAESVEEPEAPEVEAAEEASVDETAADETAFEEAPVAAEVVPFYKRELSFRRTRSTAEEAAVAGPVSENEPVDDTAEVMAQGEEHEEPVAAPELDAVAEASQDVEAAEADEIESNDAAVHEAPVDEAPAAAGRFGARRGGRTSKKPGRRKSGDGANGAKVVGLKIGASQIAAAVVSKTEAGYELLELARRPLAAGIVVDGEVRDESALATAVKAFFDEERLPRTDVRIGLSSNRIGVRTLDIVASDDEAQFDNAVRFKAHEVLPVALHESVLDYRVIEERSGEEGESLRSILLVVAPRDQVEPYERMAGLAGIKLKGIDLEALGLLRAFVEPRSTVAPKADDTATVVVSIGHESSALLVAGGGTCEFTRVFDWGGGVLEEAIASALEVRPAEAATILRHLSLTGPGRQYESLDEVARAKATEAVRLRLTPFARELVNSLQFYQTQAESLGIGGIVVTGGTSHLEGLSAALHQMIGVDVSVGDPFARVTRSGDFDPAIEAVIGSMAVPIGLAIEDGSLRSVNLLTRGAAEKRTRRSTVTAIGVPIAAAVPLAVLGFLYLGAHGKAVDQQTQLDAVKAQIAALPAPKIPTIDASIVGDEAVRATAVASVLGGRLAWDGVFRDMARVLPENVWLTGLSVAMPETGNLADATASAASAPGQAAGTPTAVSVAGFTYSQPDVARLLARLATLPSLARVTLTTSQSEILAGKPVVRFTIVADLNQTGGAS